MSMLSINYSSAMFQPSQKNLLCGVSLVVAWMVALTSCSRKVERAVPQTFPVTGRVQTNGGPVPVGGCVEFESRQSAEFNAIGVIDADGHFSLHVPYVDRVLHGATEGPHDVRIMLPIEKGGAVLRLPNVLIVQASENVFTIDMPKAQQ